MKYSLNHNKICINAFFMLLAFNYYVRAQEVGINTDNPQSSLDIRGVNNNGTVTAKDGLLAPRVNGLATAGIENGQLVYLIANTGNLKKGFYNWNGNGWLPVLLSASTSMSSTLVVPDVVISGSPSNATSFTISPNIPINDYSVFDAIIPVTGIIGNNTFVSIQINITHTWDGDLDIFLQSPTGQILELTSDNGYLGENFRNTLFIDSAPQSITAGSAPFTGSYRPEGTLTFSGTPVIRTGNITALSGFNGYNPNGNWVLRIGDDAGLDTGTFISAILNISGSNPVNWVLLGEVMISYLNDTAILVKSTYSADPLDMNGVVTAITRSTATAGAAGTLIASLPAPVLNYASASARGVGNFWLNTFNQTRDIGLTNNTVYYYQLWRKGNIETPIATNETFSLIPMRIEQ